METFKLVHEIKSKKFKKIINSILTKILLNKIIIIKLIIDFFRRNIMNLVADIINGLSSMTIVMIIGFIIVVALMTVIAKKA